ncbi:VOC family protein [Mesorhizobium onobrychidis]|uniref:VOC family protein n=1 Tax=Mesorhizobium onobrychidis TaxID=2775404 RepID=A0ABY5QSR2_9HYPH|nr:VOC family protein [Mesorhizobium onobrychidis]UVC13969.1 VOC family protein [Mesorhizobium onobrychidis]
MNDIQERGEAAIATPSARRVDIKLEVVVIPVSDVDRAKRFYGGLGWRLDADITGDEFRVIQFTPPGSPCSIVFGAGVTPGPYARVELDVLESVGELVVSDIEAARAELADRGVDVSEVYHYAGREGRVSGPDPERRSYSSWASFSDPSGNVWLLQEVTARAPGRVDADDTTFVSSVELAAALRRASAAHGEHEKRTGGQRDENWPDWYAEYMMAEQAGKPLPL